MEHTKALEIAKKIEAELRPFCDRIQIAGSIRRQKANVKDIEIVAIPNDRFQLGLIVNRWKKIRGDVGGKYIQRILPEGINLDLFFASEKNWGHILAIRTGSAEYSHLILAIGWVIAGYKSIDGTLHKGSNPIEVREEADLFRLIGLDYVEPQYREVSLDSSDRLKPAVSSKQRL